MELHWDIFIATFAIATALFGMGVWVGRIQTDASHLKDGFARMERNIEKLTEVLSRIDKFIETFLGGDAPVTYTKSDTP